MTAASMLGQLRPGDHVCGFVDTADDRLDVVARVLAGGVDAGERVLVFIDSLAPAAVAAGLRARGVPVERAVAAGQVRIFPAPEAYLPAGRFEPQAVLDTVAGYIDQATADGYAGLRLVGDLGWAADEPPGVDQLSWYERQVNRLYLDGRALGVCLYGRRGVDGALLRDVTCAHPAHAVDLVAAVGAPLLRIACTREPYGLRLVGEVDVSNRQALSAAVDAVAEQADPAETLVVDVTELRFADTATGVMLARLAGRMPGGVHLVGVSGMIATVLERLGLPGLPGMRMTYGTGSGDRGNGYATEAVA